MAPNKFSNVRSLSVKFASISGQTGRLVGQAVRRGGQAIADTAADSIEEITPGGRVYKSKGDKTKLHYAAPEGAAPNADTGALHQSITSVMTHDGPDRYRSEAGPGENIDYAKHLEFGTSKMKPRPFMGPAFDVNKKSIEASIRKAILRGARSK